MDNLENDDILSLIKGFRETGSDEVFDRIVERYTPLMVSTASKLSLDFDRIRSEACFALLKAVTTYDSGRGASFGTYAGKCIYNHLCDLVRGEKAHSVISEEVEVEKIAVVDDINSRLERREELETIGRFVRSILSDFEYRVFILWIRGYTTADIASSVDKSAKSVDNAKNRIASKLSREFAERGGIN